ncbi:MAG: hypothetical protein NVS3B10_07520 [Polyangiales bacterium]
MESGPSDASPGSKDTGPGPRDVSPGPADSAPSDGSAGSKDTGPAPGDAGPAPGDAGPGPTSGDSPFVPSGYAVTFRDEFDDPTETFPHANFYPDYHGYGGIRTLAGNGELEVYVDSSYTGSCPSAPGVNPFSIADGALTITAAPITPAAAACFGGGFQYTSGLLESVATQQYGYYELRTRLPKGRGLWPAFWMDAFDNGGLEMDVFEVLGHDPSTVYQTIHGSPADSQTLYTAIDTSDGFHVYGFEWTASTLTWTIDGTVTRTAGNYIHEPTYFMINDAVGGSWPGSPDGSTVFPANMVIDYIRVYQKK